MTLRIIGGEHGGRRIRSPKGRATRPTRSAVREAWFNAIGSRVEGAAVLDLFAGSGALGIEALSRGAATARFVEWDAAACSVIRSNLSQLGLAERGSVVRKDVFRLLGGLPTDVTLALADPPYGRGVADRLVDVWLARRFSNILCVEHHPGELDQAPADWRRQYGESVLSFYWRDEHGERT